MREAGVRRRPWSIPSHGPLPPRVLETVALNQSEDHALQFIGGNIVNRRSRPLVSQARSRTPVKVGHRPGIRSARTRVQSGRPACLRFTALIPSGARLSKGPLEWPPGLCGDRRRENTLLGDTSQGSGGRSALLDDRQKRKKSSRARRSLPGAWNSYLRRLLLRRNRRQGDPWVRWPRPTVCKAIATSQDTPRT